MLTRQMRLARFSVGCFLLFFLSETARADVWAYLDERGVPHFAAERVDGRYELFYRSNVVVTSAVDDKRLSLPPPDELPRLVSVPKTPSRLLAFFEVSPSFKGVRHLMREAAQANNIDFELLQAMIATESGFDSQAVSPKGAIGLMQIMPATAERYGVVSDARSPVEKKLTDPQTNIMAGSRYLRYLINLFSGKLELALAAYNAGEGAVQRAGNSIPKYRETENYVKTVMQLYAMLKPPAIVVELRRASVGVPAPDPAPRRPDLLGVTPGTVMPGGAARRGNMISPLQAAEATILRAADAAPEP
jgi:Transglycosylase SLT domain